MPDGLSKLEMSYWRELVPGLLKIGVLTAIDGSALAGCCMAYGEMMEARKAIDEHGLLLEVDLFNAAGEYLRTESKTNPAVAIADRAAKRWKSFLIEFGLTPASRSRLSTTPDEKPSKDPADAYFGEPQSRSGHPVQ